MAMISRGPVISVSVFAVSLAVRAPKRVVILCVRLTSNGHRLLSEGRDRKPPNVGAGTCGIWERREEAQRPLHETFRLAEARLVRHAPGGSMPSQALKHCKIQSRRDAPKVAILEVRAPKMRLVEAQCARRKHCYLETPLGSDLISRVLQREWGVGSVVVGFHVLGAPRLSVQRSRKPLKYVFWELWTGNRGAPKKLEIQARRIQPPILGPPMLKPQQN